MNDLNGNPIAIGDRVVISRGQHLDGFVGTIMTVRAIKEGDKSSADPYRRKPRCRCDNAKSVADSENGNWTKGAWLESREVAVVTP